jgi:signal peptidase I
METAKKKTLFREYAEAILIAILLALFLRTFVVQAFKIPSGSMLPTLDIGDHILVNKFVYGVKMPYLDRTLVSISRPARGDIIVFMFPEDEGRDFIKRVVAVEGDTIAIRNKQVLINGKPTEEPYAVHRDAQTPMGSGQVGERGQEPRDHFGPFTVPPGKVFVLGDNRDHSHDSRWWGTVDLEKIRGRAFLIYWSWDGGERWVRWERLGKLID